MRKKGIRQKSTRWSWLVGIMPRPKRSSIFEARNWRLTIPQAMVLAVAIPLVVFPNILLLGCSLVSLFRADQQPAALIRSDGVTADSLLSQLEHRCQTYGGSACLIHDILPSGFEFQLQKSGYRAPVYPAQGKLPKGKPIIFAAARIADTGFDKCASKGQDMVIAADRLITCATHETAHARLSHDLITPLLENLPRNFFFDYWKDVVNGWADAWANISILVNRFRPSRQKLTMERLDLQDLSGSIAEDDKQASLKAIERPNQREENPSGSQKSRSRRTIHAAMSPSSAAPPAQLASRSRPRAQ